MKNKIITLNENTYTVIGPLGKGGQASVWKVRRHSDDKELAMKSVLTAKTDAKGHAEYLTQTRVDNLGKRLQSEIDFIQRLPSTRKSFIVPCLDAGHIDDARYGQLPTWVMPLYKQTLGNKMPPYPKDKPIPILFSECLKWIEQAAIALEATHSFHTGNSRFIHRDVKASNLMLTNRDDIRLIDFGIVRETTLDEETGTHSYSAESAAPEQVLPNSINAGKSSYAIGTHTDMYALGSVFYYLFSGKQSEAQQALGRKDLYDQHIKLLDDNNTGMVGKLGGLTEDEYNDLLHHIQFRFDEEYTDPDASIITVTSGMLQNGEYIPRSVADFIRALLDPIYSNRPSAVQMRLWCQSITSALSPQLSELRLSTMQRNIAPHSPITVQLALIGKGLPASADWVEISVNGETIYTGFKPLTQDKHYFGFVKSEQTSWEFVVESKEKVRVLEIDAKALVGDRIVNDSLRIKINETAEDLWQQGKYQQALCLELRQPWLDERLQRCHSFTEAAAYSELLTSLKTCQPHQRDMIDQYQQKLEQKFNPNATPAGASTASSSAQTAKSNAPKASARVEPEFEKASVSSHAKKETKRDDIPAPVSGLKKYIAGGAIVTLMATAGYFLLKPKTDSSSNLIDDNALVYGSGGYTPTVPSIPDNTGDTSPAVVDSPSGDTPVVKPPTTPVTPKPVVPVAKPEPTPDPKPVLTAKEKAEQELMRLKADLNGNNQLARKKAWDRLQQLSKGKDAYRAKTMLANFVKQTFKLSNSSNKIYQKQAVDRLNLIATSGDKSALKLLGKAYFEGEGTEKNWAKSWQQLRRANAGQEQDTLERRANTILHNKKSTQQQRNLAYQAAEITARNEPAGDPAQKWMVYRYQAGDGVAVDKAKAKYWQEVYDGKRRLTPMVGEQW
jgi:serine/threonine protein kinase